ncbi:MAG: formylglycine-generating enzyme family protein [Oligoflexia bacterium]|nr:formylglycine-generating enzyme family protein [Oligoflexia bacterium]
MSGNAEEWTWDRFSQPLVAGAATDLAGATEGDTYTVRGGSFIHDATHSPWHSSPDEAPSSPLLKS